MRAFVVLVSLAALVTVAWAAGRPAFLPDRSEGLTGLLGPFIWSRAADLGGEARFADAEGRPDPEGRFLWLYQFLRLPRSHPPTHVIHERNNLVAVDPAVAFDVQPWRYVANCPGPHTFKLILGYVARRDAFVHGDNADLAHLAASDRVCVFLPVRPAVAPEAEARLDAKRYPLNTERAAQSICVIEWAAGEMIHYEWFKGGRLHPRILYDLAPHFEREKALYPAETKPIIRFTIGDEGAWTLRFERDGRDGLAGGEVEGDWDLEVTHASPGAKPYTVDVPPATSRWALSTFSPGGTPEESSEMLLGLSPFDRASGEVVPWPDRTRRLRTFETKDLDAVLAGKDPGRFGGHKAPKP